MWMNQAALMSQMAVLPGDADNSSDVMPAGILDEDQQQLDLRPVNSWRLSLGEISAAEYLETHLINAAAPFVLNSELKELLCRSPAEDRCAASPRACPSPHLPSPISLVALSRSCARWLVCGRCLAVCCFVLVVSKLR